MAVTAVQVQTVLGVNGILEKYITLGVELPRGCDTCTGTGTVQRLVSFYRRQCFDFSVLNVTPFVKGKSTALHPVPRTPMSNTMKGRRGWWGPGIRHGSFRVPGHAFLA